jgi:chemotaxis protein CheX
MSFIKNILIIDHSEKSALALKDLIEAADNKLNVDFVQDKSRVTQKTAAKEYSAVLLNGNVGLKDSLYCLRIFTMARKKNKSKGKVFFMSEEFDIFQGVIARTEYPDLQVINSPVTNEEILETLVNSVTGKKIEANLVKETGVKGTINLDMDFIRIFIESTKKVFQEMGQAKYLKNSKPQFLTKMSEPLRMGVTSKILISSKYFKGSFFIIFPEDTFLKFYSAVIFEEQDEINDENKDFATEFANIVYGQSKKTFSESGFNLDMVIPTIFDGSEIKSKDPVIVTPFESDLGLFYIAVAPNLL